MSSVDYFVDRATPRAMAALRYLEKTSGHKPASITALESGGRPDIPVADFFAGDLRTPEGEAISQAAAPLATTATFAGVDWLLDREPKLAELNRSIGRGTLRLLMAFEAYGSAYGFLLKVLAARTLNPTSQVLVASTEMLPDSVVSQVVPDLVIHSYPASGLLRRYWDASRIVLGALRRRMQLRLRSGKVRVHLGKMKVMASHDNDLISDPTLRGQPHWIWDQDDHEDLGVLVFPGYHTSKELEGLDMEPFEKAGVHVLSDAELGYSRREASGTALDRDLASLGRVALRLAATSSDPRTRRAAGAAFRLLDETRTVSAVAKERDVRCFLTAESHLLQSQAMAVVAEKTGVPLVAYQYSNLYTPTPAMLSTADHFLLFHKDFRSVFEYEGVAPGNFHATGYLYDCVFDRVRERSEEHRRSLEASGARFVICLFDESVSDAPYGSISSDAHLHDIHVVLRYLLDMPDVGLVIKSQFQFNTPSQLYPEDSVLREAAQTGRYLELNVSGNRGRRNVVYPAEAALVSDIALGNMLGGTASLEAALVGCRSLLVDSHRQRRPRRDLYDKADIVYPSMESAIEAIRQLRQGDPSAAGLGDWSPIIDQMDAFRDGRSALRLKSFLRRLSEDGEV
jgi:hypothetical protein